MLPDKNGKGREGTPARQMVTKWFFASRDDNKLPRTCWRSVQMKHCEKRSARVAAGHEEDVHVRATLASAEACHGEVEAK
jgi:hypothetical protein